MESMKHIKRAVLVAVTLVLMLSMTACNVKSVDGGYDDDGNYKPSEKGTTLQFWGWGDDVEGQVFEKLKNDFNATIGKENNITVRYNKIPSNSYETNTKLALSSSNTPDVVYIADGSVKSWAEQGWLTQLDNEDDNFLTKSGGIDIDAMWPSAVNRYRYDPVSTTSDNDDPLWGLPKDIGPTVIYYNKTYIENAGVTIVSVPESEITEKVGTVIPGTTKKYSYRGFDKSEMVFNNQIAMSWEETVELAKLIMAENQRCDYGFFTEWWFNYGWSVGGDCMEYVTDENGKPYYKFTLGDETKNYIVQDDVASLTVGGGALIRAEK